MVEPQQGTESEDGVREYLHQISERVPGALEDLGAYLGKSDIAAAVDPKSLEVQIEGARTDQWRVMAARAVLLRQGISPIAGLDGDRLVPEDSSPIAHHAAEVRSCRLGNLAVVLLPALRSITHCWQVLDVINHLYTSEYHEAEWLLDCSSLRNPETIFLSSLLGYERELRKRGRRLRLVWLAEESVPEPLREHFELVFQLVRQAGHYFSR